MQENGNHINFTIQLRHNDKLIIVYRNVLPR